MSDFGFGESTGAEEFSLDFTNAEDVPDFTPLPAGKYQVIVNSVDVGKSKTNKAMVTLHLAVAEGPHEGRQLRDWIVMPDVASQTPEAYKQSIDFLCAKLEAITGEQWKGQQKKLKPRELVGRICDAIVTIGTNNTDGSPTNNVKRYVPADKASTSSGASGFSGGF